MAKTFITSGTGASQTLDAIQNEKVPVYNTRADAEADLANIEEGGIVATKDTGATEKVVDVVEDGNMNPVTSNAVYDALNDTLVYDDATIGLYLVKKGNVVQGLFRHNVTDTERTITYQNVIPAEFRSNLTATTSPRNMLINNTIDKPIGQAIFGYDGNFSLWAENANTFDGSEFISFITYLV